MAFPSFCHTEFLGNVFMVFMFLFMAYMVFRSDFVNEIILFKNMFLSVLFAVLKFLRIKYPQISEVWSPFLQVEKGEENPNLVDLLEINDSTPGTKKF